MKKYISLICILLAALILCACGSAAPAATPTPEASAAPEDNSQEAPANMFSTLPGSADVEDEDEEPAAEENPDMLAASELIGQSVDKLIEAIGEPESKDYASSCLGPGDDGEWHYNGFTVYTYKENGEEVVQDVE